MICIFIFKISCKVSKNGCPIKKGPWEGSFVQLTPRIAFPGNYTSKATTTEVPSGKLLSCIE